MQKTTPPREATPEELASIDRKNGQLAYGPVDGPFEAPAAKIVPGRFYADAAEILPAVAEDSEQGPSENAKDLAVDRRDFMRLFSTSAMLASAAACIRRPEEIAKPYVNQPIDQPPGVAVHYATTCGECTAACGIIVKTREGRPTKIEGNPRNELSQGGTCARGQASIQGLYHPERRKSPLIRRGKRLDVADWDEAFEVIAKKLGQSKNIGIFTGGSTGNRHEFYKRFLKNIGAPETNVYTYESNQLLSSIAAAHQIAFGGEVIPRAELRNAEMIVGIGSDFLDLGISQVFHMKSFADMHSVRASIASGNGQHRLVQLESTMTQTGGRADERHVIAPGSEVYVTLALVQALMEHPQSKGSAAEREEIKRVLAANGAAVETATTSGGVSKDLLAKLAGQMLERKSVVLCGGSASFNENATNLQLAAIMANTLVGAYGDLLFIDRGWMLPPVKSGDLARFMTEADTLDALIIIDSNPAFTLPESFGFTKKLEKIATVVSIQSMPNETDEFAGYLLNGHHSLESWGDEQPVAGVWSLRQPTIRPVTNSRQAEDILLWLAAALNKPMGVREYREYLMAAWKPIHALVSSNDSPDNFETFFRKSQKTGSAQKLAMRSLNGMANIAKSFAIKGSLKSGLKLLSPLDNRLTDGRGADKPLLQEVGDSMTTIAWDSWIALNPKTAERLGLKRNDVVKVEGPGGSLSVALYPLPGLHPDAAVIHRGNGHKPGISKVSTNVGVDPLSLYSTAFDSVTGYPVTSVIDVTLTRTGQTYKLAAMQKHNDIADRTQIVNTVTYEKAKTLVGKTKDLDTVPDLYPTLPQGDYRWGLAIDLAQCTGCSACMVACSIENNVPQVGREQVAKGREMHWIRLDRYFAGDVDNPEVTYQPVMCQHCNHAPCEAVCPVFATNHDPEGLNVITYNRCVGTRYCANACPYKVRRFNWFTFSWNQVEDDPTKRSLRALNPDITVRTRGIVEKCSMCFQRIREAKHKAKEENTRIVDGNVKTACAQVCPSNAITFGELSNPQSRVSEQRRDGRAYLLLGGEPEHGHYGLKTLPNVSYLANWSAHEAPNAHESHKHAEEDHHG